MQPTQKGPRNRQYRGREIEAHDAGRGSPNERVGGRAEEPPYYTESPPVAPPNYARRVGFEKHRFASATPSIGNRVFRAVARFSFAVLVGVGATLAWQSYGHEAGMVVRTWAPSLSWLLPVSMTESTAAATLPELEEQLKPMSLDLAIVRRSLEQLATNQNQLANKQEEIAQNVAALQAAAQEIGQAVHNPPRKPQSPPGQPQH
jgi:hypothetical protein